MTVGPETALYTLIGDPVGHSLSPLIHNTAFVAHAIDAVYVATRVRSGDLVNALRGLDALGFRGANVTIPHKLGVMDHLTEVTDTARRVGAVNTIRIDRAGGTSKLVGDNTDAAGFAGPLLSSGQESPRSALILGAGGASRAVIHACIELIGVDEITVAARRESQAAGLVEDFGDGASNLTVSAWSGRASVAAQAELIVNCTPLGMHPNLNSSPLDDTSGIGSGQTVYDLVYAPARTRLLEDAGARGAETIPGIEMLIGQAAAAFRWWTGMDMPLHLVREAARRHLDGTNG